MRAGQRSRPRTASGRPHIREDRDLSPSEHLQRPDMSVTIAGVTFRNPVMTASGTFGSGMEYAEFIDLAQLGAVVTK